jgi:hypothetical protein
MGASVQIKTEPPVSGKQHKEEKSCAADEEGGSVPVKKTEGAL